MYDRDNKRGPADERAALAAARLLAVAAVRACIGRRKMTAIPNPHERAPRTHPYAVRATNRYRTAPGGDRVGGSSTVASRGYLLLQN